MGFFKIGSHELFAQGCLSTPILLISAFLVDRISGVSNSAWLVEVILRRGVGEEGE
jgi:hypothetical protein